LFYIQESKAKGRKEEEEGAR